MDEAQVSHVDRLAETAYGGTAPAAERQRVEAMLNDLRKLDNLPALRFVLERSSNEYSRFFCSSSILMLITNNWNSFISMPGKPHLELRTWLLSFIGQKGASLQKYLLVAVINILCRLTKLGWLDNEDFRGLPSEVHKFFICNSTWPGGPVIGLMILNQLVSEINTSCPKMTFQAHRKTTASFRDVCLFEVFKVALTALEASSKSNDTGIETQTAVSLALACLSFDFVGVFTDESTDDAWTVHVPTAWKAVLIDNKVMHLFWKLYGMLPVPDSTNILKCVVQFVSVRRSLFSDDAQRSEWLGNIIEGILHVLRNKTGLNDPQNYHEFCKLLSRIKPNYMLTEIVNLPFYDDWIRLSAQFTVDSFVNWKQTANSSYYLLSLWQRFLAASLYVKSSKPSMLQEYAPNVISSYIQSRLEVARACIEIPGEVENALEDDGMLSTQLESFPQIAKSAYEKVGPYLVQLAMPEYNFMAQYIAKVQAQGNASPPDQQQALMIVDCRLSWLIYMMGSIVSYHSTLGQNEHAEGLDGELTALVLELSKLVMARLSIPGHAEMTTLQRLQSAILYFLNGFRKIYIGETSPPCLRVYPKLKELTGIEDSIGVLSVIVDIILNIMKHWKCSKRLLAETTGLLLELSTGYSCSKLLLKLDGIRLLLTQHRHFAFMENPENFKQRTRFYRAVTSLLFRESTSEATFDTFMKPLYERALQLDLLTEPQFQQTDVRIAIVGWLRDIRGVCFALENKRTYGLFFDWLFPFLSSYHSTDKSRAPLLIRFCQAYTNDNEVMHPLLRLYNDLVHNNTQRIAFESSSPNGILLFRETCALLKTYGVAKLQELCPAGGWNIQPIATSEDSDTYSRRYKGFSLCISILTRALVGGYCNFGVFTLYQDPALDDALEVVLKM
eukprot:gene23061-35335_t